MRQDVAYCPQCGAALAPELVEGRERPVCPACRFVVYLDPKVSACTIVKMDGGLVFARRAIEPGRGMWTLPGGYMDRGETVEEAARREVREEVGLEVRLDGLVGVYSYHESIVVVVVYYATAVGGKLIVGHETLEVACVPPERIPWEELAFRSSRQALQDYLVVYVNPNAP